jgi:hypothetical protein
MEEDARDGNSGSAKRPRLNPRRTSDPNQPPPNQLSPGQGYSLFIQQRKQHPLLLTTPHNPPTLSHQSSIVGVIYPLVLTVFFNCLSFFDSTVRNRTEQNAEHDNDFLKAEHILFFLLFLWKEAYTTRKKD